MPKLLKVRELHSPHGAAALVELISCIYFKPSLRVVSLGLLWAQDQFPVHQHILYHKQPDSRNSVLMQNDSCPPAKAANPK